MTTVIALARRARNAADRRARIETAALATFAEKGFAATSVDEIVARADVAKGTFFVHFPTKSAVLAGYYRSLDAKFLATLACLDSSRPEAAMASYYRTSERRLRAEGALARVLFEAIVIDPTLGGMDRASGEDTEHRVATFLTAARECGTIDPSVDTILAARVFTDLWSATVREWFESGQAFGLAKRLIAKAHLLFAGLRPRGST